MQDNGIDVSMDGVATQLNWSAHSSTFFHQSHWHNSQITEDILMRGGMQDKKHNAKTIHKKKYATYHNGERMYIPSDRDIQDAINFAIITSDMKYISFTRYEDEPVIDYMKYAWLIRSTEDVFEYDQKFLIDQAIGIHYIRKYRTIWKRFEMMLRENPMIWAGIVSFIAVLFSWTALRFITRILDKFVRI